MKKDNVLSIPVPNSSLIFTRYLYVKDEVRIALLFALLNKSDDAFFWAEELYESLFQYELRQLLIKIYYDFYAILNPSFMKLLLDDTYTYQNVIASMLFMPFTTDMFYMRVLSQYIELDMNYNDNKSAQENIQNWIDTNDYRSLTQYVMSTNFNYNDVSSYHIKYLNDKRIDINKNIDVNKKIIILASLIKKRRKLIDVEYDYTINDIKHINSSQMLGLFRLERQSYNLKDKYWYHWLYHASFSPLWAKRIHNYKAYPDYKTQTIIFLDDDKMEEFYNAYDLEPDEEPLMTQEKRICDISVVSWKMFYNKYSKGKKHNHFHIFEEELEEMDNIRITY